MIDKRVDRTVQIVLGFGAEDHRKKLTDGLVEGNRIDEKKVAHMVNKCRDLNAALLADENMLSALTDEDRQTLKHAFSKIDGEAFVANSDPDELVEWVLEMYKENERPAIFEREKMNPEALEIFDRVLLEM